ncbi:hypothetical protein A3717_17685 [Alcanivorax sp. HI0013]|nr:hypothetical protein A3717_17685 [Alcanivorax sp. HI0013]KZY27791.1 hypothetical protein A3725_16515 [Alcanivorax sp. HI0035]
MGCIISSVLIVDIHFQNLVSDTHTAWSPSPRRVFIIFAQNLHQKIQRLPFIGGIGSKTITGQITILAGKNVSCSA